MHFEELLDLFLKHEEGATFPLEEIIGFAETMLETLPMGEVINDHRPLIQITRMLMDMSVVDTSLWQQYSPDLQYFLEEAASLHLRPARYEVIDE